MSHEEVVTVPADVQAGGVFEHTFASGKTVQVTVPLSAGPGYRLTLDEKRMAECNTASNHLILEQQSHLGTAGTVASSMCCDASSCVLC